MNEELAIFVPYMSDEEILNRANEFLERYHPDLSTPVPIEEIVEISLGIEIIPTPGIQQNYDSVSFLSNNLKTIYIDEWIFRERVKRYRYSLAHELGHVFLHRQVVESIKVDSYDSWLTIVSEITPALYSKLEYQAHCFAGMILVPQVKLKEEFDRNYEALLSLVDQAKQQTNRRGYIEITKRFLADQMSEDFNVSTEVLLKRINNGGIEHLIP